MSPDSTPPSRLPAWLRTTWGKVVAVAGVGATVIGAVGIAVTVTEALGQRQSTVDTVTVDSELVGRGDTDVVAAVAGIAAEKYGSSSNWAVPADADFAEFWALPQDGPFTDTNLGCTDSQAAWLNEHGTLYVDGWIRAQLSNDGTAGSSIVVKNIRAEGVLTPPEGDVVRVTCVRGVGGEPLAQYANLAIGSDEFAVYSDVEEGCENPDGYCWYAGENGAAVTMQPGSPVVFDMAPGEFAILVLEFTANTDFTGKIVATVLVDGVESTLNLTPGDADLVMPFITTPLPYLEVQNGGAFYCVESEDARPLDCTPEVWSQLVTAAIAR